MAYVVNLQVFVRVFELGSISAAARDLRVSPAVASTRLADLERHLDIRLFNRTTRSLQPTEQGKVFYDGAVKILQTIEDAEANIADITQNPRGTIFLAANLHIGRTIIAPQIPEFLQKYPHIKIRYRLSDRRIDVANEGLDMVFMVGQPETSNMRMRTISECTRGLFAAPAYLAKHGTPTSMNDLTGEQHNCLQLRYPGTVEFRWPLLDGKTYRDIAVEGTCECDDSDVLTQWALDGAGIVLKPHFEISEHLQSGALVEILQEHRPKPVPLVCVFPERRLQDPKLRLFMEYIIAHCRNAVKDQEPR